MALHKLTRPKQFHVDYCGCTAAALLLNDQTIRDAIDFIRRIKTKRDFVKTSITVLKDGVKIMYSDDQKFSTVVPSSMIAGSTVGKASFEDTVGVVYISPLNGQHYPAFVHVYRCDSPRSAQKLLSRLRTYLLVESHRLQIVQLEQLLLTRNLLNIDRFNSRNSQKNNAGVSSSSSSSSSLLPTTNDIRQDKVDPIKSITEEIQKKINSHDPILFPPKDYDTIHAAHGNIQRAQAWRSTQPTIVGYSPIDSDGRSSQHPPTGTSLVKDERKNKIVTEYNNVQSQLSTHRSDVSVDPVEAVSLAFDFLKDETSSIFTDNDGNNIEHVEIQQKSKPSAYIFRPSQITGVAKNIFARNNKYDLTNDISKSNASSRNDLDAYNKSHKNNYNDNYNNHHFIQNKHRTRSEMRLDSDEQSNKHHNHVYESRLINGNSNAVMMNPIWTAQSPTTAGSQPNLLSPQNFIDSTPIRRQPSSSKETRMSSIPAQTSLYASYPDDKSAVRKQEENQQKRLVPTQNQSNRKQTAQSQYLDTNEFILRASNGQPLRHSQYPNGYLSRDSRPHSMNDHGAMLDVYY